MTMALESFFDEWYEEKRLKFKMSEIKMKKDNKDERKDQCVIVA